MQLQTSAPQRSSAAFRLAILPVLVSAALIAGCGGGDDKKGASQAAARVNDQEVTVHQINLILERQPGLKPEQAEAASRQVLEGLIDQELAVQKAEEEKLDRDPKLVQILDAQRRATLARFYLDKASSAALGTPSADEVRKYFNENPGLFSDRRIYMLQEFAIQGTPEQTRELQARLEATDSAQGFAEVLKGSGMKFAVNQVTQPAESLPLNLVGRISKVKDGEALFEQGNGGMKAMLVVASRPQPLTLEQAKPMIERFLTETRRQEWLKTHLKNLRESANVEYIGKFAEKPADAASQAADATAAPAPVATTTPEPAATQTQPASGLDSDALSKGLSGLK